MNPQTVIVYRSKLEQETSEFWAPYIPYLAMTALVLLLGFFVVMGIVSMIAKSARNKRYNSSHYD